MTFENAPSAIDGALLSAALIRRAQFADQPFQGVVTSGDLKVTALSTPGVGVRISPGVGLVLNRYQTVPNETYVVSNPGTHTVPAVDMPPSSPSAKSFIVAVVIGDPDFSQTGHPFMAPSDPPAGQEQAFEYVRIRLIEVSAGTTTLPGAYPALPLARLDIPANTTTITNSHITNLAKLASPRQEQQLFVSPGGAWTDSNESHIPSGSTHLDWGGAQYSPSVTIPTWAKRAILVVHVNGVKIQDTSVNIQGSVRAQLGSEIGSETRFDFSTGGGAVRTGLMCASEYDVAGMAGETRGMRIEGYEQFPASPSLNQRLRLTAGSQMIFDVRFFEE